ncbi:metal-sensitive transcriptional regulator [Clostridium frigidicarnis]|uniref:DNA-binding transcriptional regulator, FrmR family n=1 Tax=Clostridium frigidicarnis TaxID=84698 RepID=A0A1I0VMI4_9CLOT|nr:metal-sensitive transcriptional regulator [Clostridium frigidicarnis]SFA77080.1 DNA-binding transcriptional regulator, FrmR family [Clostridium frigidicarnis]
MDSKKQALKKDVLVRLRRIEGQVKGIQNMVDKEVCCKEVLVQVAAVRAAMNKVGGLMLENYAYNCMEFDEEDEKVQQLISALVMFLK